MHYLNTKCMKVAMSYNGAHPQGNNFIVLEYIIDIICNSTSTFGRRRGL